MLTLHLGTRKMNYKDKILRDISNIDNNLINLEIERKKAAQPTQVFSEFLTNKNQGDWAEETLLSSINNQSNQFIAVKYGLNNDKVAGEPGFEDFYSKYQDELDNLGKKPDLLIFNKFSYDIRWNYDLTNLSEEELERIVPLALCGLEVRSSSFLWKIYNKNSAAKKKVLTDKIITLKNELLDKHSNILKEQKKSVFLAISAITSNNGFRIKIPTFSYRKTEELSIISEKIRELRSLQTDLLKRDYLSITPKIEDLKVVNNWIQKYNVPHFYVQVFFDCAFMIGYEKILTLLVNNGVNKNSHYSIESGDAKNQNKSTIKIDVTNGFRILDNIALPKTKSAIRQLDKGRLLLYLKFEPSSSDFIESSFMSCIGES